MTFDIFFSPSSRLYRYGKKPFGFLGVVVAYIGRLSIQ